jgi:hypothetical protein
MNIMQRHLTDEELDAVLMGAGDAHAAHMDECEACSARLAEMRATVGSLREGVLLWSASRPVRTGSAVLYAAQNANPKRQGWFAVPAMGLAAALVVGMMVPHWTQERRQEVASRRAQAAQAAAKVVPDDVLMQQVQQQLDESVPTSMAPLTALIQTEDPHKAARQAKEN